MSLKSFVPAIIYFIITLVLLTLPGDDLPKSDLFNIPNFDKYVHTGLFFLLTIVFYSPLQSINISFARKKNWLIAVAVMALAYGIAIEFVQKYLVPHRSFDKFDILFDAFGCFFGWMVGRKLIVKK
ncbi:MAG: hypothetical protein JWQ96_319 [Segetibacter sp.]|nr:hypothetical protein [Segetibacter sp.]